MSKFKKNYKLCDKKAIFGAGTLFAFLLLLMVELWLHTDSFLFRYRSVFAAGRAMDKILYIEKNVPATIILGNSRVDNGFDPKTLKINTNALSNGIVFNLGIPGANARFFYDLFY